MKITSKISPMLSKPHEMTNKDYINFLVNENVVEKDAGTLFIETFESIKESPNEVCFFFASSKLVLLKYYNYNQMARIEYLEFMKIFTYILTKLE